MKKRQQRCNEDYLQAIFVAVRCWTFLNVTDARNSYASFVTVVFVLGGVICCSLMILLLKTKVAAAVCY